MNLSGANRVVKKRDDSSLGRASGGLQQMQDTSVASEIGRICVRHHSKREVKWQEVGTDRKLHEIRMSKALPLFSEGEEN